VTVRRVLVPTMFAHWGGSQRVLADGLPLLSKAPGIRVEYSELCRNETEMSRMAQNGVVVNRTVGVVGPGVLSNRRGIGRALDLAKASPFLLRLVRSLSAVMDQYDVVYVHHYRELVLASLASLRLRARSRPRLVWHCHDLRKVSRILLGAALVKRCAAIIAVSESIAGQLAELGVPREIVRVVYNGVDARAIREMANHLAAPLPERLENEVILLVPSASLQRVKGVHIALEALRELPSHLSLWITGQDYDLEGGRYLAELDRLVVESGMGRRVRFLGLRSDIYAVMAAADVVVVPSLWREPFGLVAAEALALGRPLVVSRRGALPEIVDYGKAGVLFDPSAAGSLAASVNEVLANPAATKERAAKGLCRVADVLGCERWTREISELLGSLPVNCSSTRPRRPGAAAEAGGNHTMQKGA
jgi:glycosyltransferase involved in cell wall biosynthesis